MAKLATCFLDTNRGKLALVWENLQRKSERKFYHVRPHTAQDLKSLDDVKNDDDDVLEIEDVLGALD